MVTPSPESEASVIEPEKDRVDEILRQWRHERPDLKLSAMGVVGRVLRASRRIDRDLARFFKGYDLDFGLFDVLATLRRSGQPYSLSPRELNDWCMLTSGAMTARLDRLEAAGYVVRRPDPQDRRGLLIELSPTGFDVVDKLVTVHVANEEHLLAGLSPAERHELSNLLRRLLLSLEPGQDNRERTAADGSP